MCGIAGFVDLKAQMSHDALHVQAVQMAERIIHRGPDAGDVWADASAGIALAHRRLSILDLSPLGSQPMHSQSGRYVIVYNGEIYNFAALRQQLSVPFKGHSDTEVLLACIEAWGLSRTLESIHGMFAFALFDRQERKLYLARDRMGEKPLYYSLHNGFFIFGSELKALKAHPAFDKTINRNALAMMMRHNHVPAPHCIYENAQKLLPGCYITLDVTSGAAEHGCYWSTQAVAQYGERNPLAGNVAAQLEGLLRDSVKRMMVSDVPLGAFLSGGVDSSLVVALMQQESSRPVKTFTIGFEDKRYDESAHAAAVAQHLGTEHTQLLVTEAQAMAVIEQLPAMYDEPFADSSQIPTYLVAKLARQHVTVALSGDAGDELFGGYNRHRALPRLMHRLRHVPVPVQRAISRLLLAVPPHRWDALLIPLMRILPQAMQMRLPGEKLTKLAELLPAGDLAALYNTVTSQWENVEELVPGAQAELQLVPPMRSKLHSVMLWDQLGYLPGDILTKVDRAAMAVSLETRIPLLDPQVVELAWRLPPETLFRGSQGKAPLREILYRYVPRQLIERPKMGFGVPIESWLRGELKDWASSLLEPSRITQDGYLNTKLVSAMWQEHLSGRHNHQHALWNVLMFQAWLENEKSA